MTNISTITDTTTAASTVHLEREKIYHEPLFYMDNSPPQDSPPKNSELVGEDDDDDENNDENEEDNNTHVNAISHCTTHATDNYNNNSSLATVAGGALEKLVGLAVGIPTAVASTTDDAMDSRSDDHLETEVYLDTDVDKSSFAKDSTMVAQGTQESTSTPASPTTDSTGDNESTHSTESLTPTMASGSSANRACDINASKDILTEGQAFAYVGLCLVTANTLFQAFEGSETAHAKESLECFVSKLINRLYRHLDIDANSKSRVPCSHHFSTAQLSDFVAPMAGVWDP